MKKGRIAEMLGIEYPIFQGGMAWIADADLASAVSNAGGLGIIAAGNADTEYVRGQVRKAKEMTSKPFGLNIMLLSPFADEIAQMVVEEDVKVVTTGAGNAGKYMSLWNEAGVKVIPVVPSVTFAKMAARTGAFAVIAEGGESGGHIGELATMTLVPQVCDAVDLPVIAAGGIADGRGIAAALSLGAEAVQLGTRFLSATECNIHENYRKKVFKAGDRGIRSEASRTSLPENTERSSIRIFPTRNSISSQQADCAWPLLTETRKKAASWQDRAQAWSQKSRHVRRSLPTLCRMQTEY